MEQWLEKSLSGWPVEQRREVEEHLKGGRFISFVNGRGNSDTEESIQKWSPWEKEDDRGLLQLKDEAERSALTAVRLKLPDMLHPSALQKAALLRGVAFDIESDSADTILLRFKGLSQKEIDEGLKTLEEEISLFTARYEL